MVAPKANNKNGVVSIKRSTNKTSTKIKLDVSDEQERLKAEVLRIENLFRNSFAKRGLPLTT